MADNVNAQAIKVSNEKVRPACDLILQIYFYMKALQAESTAQGWPTLYPTGDPTGELKDGAATDGREVITNADVTNAFTALGAFITFMEATSNQQLNRFLKLSVNPEPKG
jgi:hypothetical protein